MKWSNATQLGEYRTIFDLPPVPPSLSPGLKLDSLINRRKAAKTTMLYKIINGHVEVTTDQPWLTPTPRQLRSHDQKFLVPSCKTNILKASFLPSAIRLWNDAPVEAIQAATPQAFKSNILGWLRRPNKN